MAKKADTVKKPIDNTYKYELKSLQEILNIHDKMPKSHEDYQIITSLKNKTRESALYFSKVIDAEWIKNYLDDKFPINVLCDLHSYCERNGVAFSRSHYNWLGELRNVKLQWEWDLTKSTKDQNMATTQLNLDPAIANFSVASSTIAVANANAAISTAISKQQHKLNYIVNEFNNMQTIALCAR
jgi:hypothetical protein